MNCIEYCLMFIKRHIPREVLEVGFLCSDDSINRFTSIDDKLINKVINSIIKVDLNLVGGVITHIELARCQITTIDQTHEFLIRVPKALTGGRSIINIHHLMSRLYSRDDLTFVSQYKNMLPSMGIANKMLSATNYRSVVSTSRLELIGENVIICKEPTAYLYNTILECQVENHNNLENINRQSFEYVANLALLATKMYIWTNKIVSINMGELYGGHDLNAIKDIIDEYKDAYEQYTEALKYWSAQSIINSKLKMREYVRMLLGQNM